MIGGHMNHGIAKGASQCKGAKPRQALRLWSCERLDRIDQDLT
jgi:hypothetical protein